MVACLFHAYIEINFVIKNNLKAIYKNTGQIKLVF